MPRFACAIILAASALASSPDATAATTTFNCRYTAYSDEEGLHAAKKPFGLTFLLAPETNKAYMLGNNGSAEVSLIPNLLESGFTLIEITPAGNVMTTTIATKGKSVHSRNGILFGELAPSQYYGECSQK